jgi:hypothetical protein
MHARSGVVSVLEMIKVLRVVIALLVSIATVSACGGDDGGDSASGAKDDASTTVASQPELSLDELAAAMPGDADLPDGYSFTTRCLRSDDPDCVPGAEHPYVSVAAERSPRTAGDFFAIVATLLPDADAAADQVASSRAESNRENGRFDIPVEQQDDGTYEPGQRGQGALEDATVEGWTGYQLVSSFEYVHPDGATDPMTMAGTLVLAKGNTVVQVQVALGQDRSAGDTPGPHLEEWATKVIDHLA